LRTKGPLSTFVRKKPTPKMQKGVRDEGKEKTTKWTSPPILEPCRGLVKRCGGIVRCLKKKFLIAKQRERIKKTWDMSEGEYTLKKRTKRLRGIRRDEKKDDRFHEK